MADEPKAGADPQQPEENKSEPQTPGQPTPTTNPTEPVKSDAVQNESTPPLDPSQVIAFQREDGTEGVATVADLVNAYNNKSPNVDPDRLKQVELLEKAITQSDPGAAEELMALWKPQANAGAAQPDGTTPPPQNSEEVRQLREQVAQLGAQVQAFAPHAQRLSSEQTQQMIRAQIAQYQDKLPYMKQYGDGAEVKVEQHAKALMEQLRAAGRDPGKLNQAERQNILARAMVNTEVELRDSATRFKGWSPNGSETPAKEPVKATDDQVKASDQIPAGMTVVDGRVVNSYGQTVQQRADGGIEAIPSDGVSPISGGQTVSAGGQEKPKGPFTLEMLKQDVRDQIQQAQGVGQ